MSSEDDGNFLRTPSRALSRRASINSKNSQRSKNSTAAHSTIETGSKVVQAGNTEYTKSHTIQGENGPSALLRGITGSSQLGFSRLGTQTLTPNTAELNKFGNFSVIGRLGTAMVGRVNTMLDNHHH